MKKISVYFIYFLSFIYMEFLLRYLVLGPEHILAWSNVNMVLFIAFFAMLMFIISKLFSEKTNKIVFYIIMILFAVWFSAQYVLKGFFGFYLTFSAFGLSDQVANGFIGDAITQILQRIVGIIFMFLPLVIAIILRKKINFKQNKAKKNIVLIILMVFAFGLYYGSLFIGKDEDYSPYKLFYEINDPALNIEKVGVLNTLCVDSFRTVFGFSETINYSGGGNKKDEPSGPIVYDYNYLNIDFDGLINSMKDKNAKALLQFMNDKGTKQNEYTGYYKGKNLILFMAESFNEIAVSKELTPNLYKMANSSFVFKNFYTPTIYSTIGGEFQELSGLYAQNLDVLTKFRAGTNYYPTGLSTIFEEEDYNTFAYHDSFSTFQNRDSYLKALGFDNFEGCESTKNEMNCYPWPGSDEEMIEVTYENYINSEEPFMVFYASVSGHGDYTSSSAYYYKYKDKLDEYYGKEVPVESKAYVAGQMELDAALGRLLEILEENGKLEDTVIALVGDHAPYYLYEKDMKYINALSSYKRDNKIELFHSNFILYNSETPKTVIEKVGSQIDVIPTLYNLFGLKYDSRLYAGNDILSTEPGLAMMSDTSWVSDEGKYTGGKFTQTSENELDDDYVDNMNATVQLRKQMSGFIINNNLYKTVWNYVKENEE